MIAPLIAVVGLKKEAKLLADPKIIVVVGGGDDRTLKVKLETTLKQQPVRGVISIGIGGGLWPALKVGDWVVADSIACEGGGWSTDADFQISLVNLLSGLKSGRVILGPIAAGDVMLVDATAKAALHARTGALAVDMESHLAAHFAANRGLPFAALRVISDGADRTLPEAAQAGMTTDGGMDVLAVMKALARDPRQLPALIRTGLEAEVAFRQLALLNRHDLLGRLGVGNPDLGELALDVV